MIPFQRTMRMSKSRWTEISNSKVFLNRRSQKRNSVDLNAPKGRLPRIRTLSMPSLKSIKTAPKGPKGPKFIDIKMKEFADLKLSKAITKVNFGNTIERMVDIDKELVQDLKPLPRIRTLNVIPPLKEKPKKKEKKKPRPPKDRVSFSSVDTVYIIGDNAEEEPKNIVKPKSKEDEVVWKNMHQSMQLLGISLKKHQKNLVKLRKEDDSSPAKSVSGISDCTDSSQQSELKRVSGISKEIKMELKRHKLSYLASESKKKLVKLRAENVVLKKKIETIKEKVEKIKKKHREFKYIGNSHLKLSQEEMDLNVKIIKARKKIESLIEQKRQGIEDLEFSLFANKREIASLSNDHFSYKDQLEVTMREQIKFYYPILKEGTDTRDLGMVWVINMLKVLGEEVKITMMPKFLDPECINFLLELSTLHQDVESLQAKIKKCKGNIILDRAKNNIDEENNELLKAKSEDKEDLLKSLYFSSLNKNEEKTEKAIFMTTQMKMKSMLQTSTFKNLKFADPRKQRIADDIIKHQVRKIDLDIKLRSKDKGRNDDSVQLDIRSSINSTSEEEIDDLKFKIKEYEEDIARKKKRKTQLIFEEIRRLIREFKAEAYAERFETSLAEVTNALFSKPLSYKDLNRILNGTKTLNLLLK